MFSAVRFPILFPALPIPVFPVTRQAMETGPWKQSTQTAAWGQTLCSGGFTLKAGPIWGPAPFSFQASLWGQWSSLPLGSKLFSSGSDFQDGKHL